MCLEQPYKTWNYYSRNDGQTAMISNLMAFKKRDCGRKFTQPQQSLKHNKQRDKNGVLSDAVIANCAYAWRENGKGDPSEITAGGKKKADSAVGAHFLSSTFKWVCGAARQGKQERRWYGRKQYLWDYKGGQTCRTLAVGTGGDNQFLCKIYLQVHSVELCSVFSMRTYYSVIGVLICCLCANAQTVSDAGCDQSKACIKFPVGCSLSDPLCFFFSYAWVSQKIYTLCMIQLRCFNR